MTITTSPGHPSPPLLRHPDCNRARNRFSCPAQYSFESRYTDRYAFEVSADGQAWGPATKGEFSNIRNNPLEQVVSIPPVRGRFVRFTIDRVLAGRHVTCAEFGVLTGAP